jgi:hypothetical protein
MTRRRATIIRRSGGFASIMAIFMIILVGAVLATTAAYFVAEARRTRVEAEDAQLRQLITAGAAAACQSEPVTTLELPSKLSSQQAKVEITNVKSVGDVRDVTIKATLGGRHMDESLHLTRSGDRWTIASVNANDDDDNRDHPPASTQPSDRSTAASQRS